jgi:hypothetical protein
MLIEDDDEMRANITRSAQNLIHAYHAGGRSEAMKLLALVGAATSRQRVQRILAEAERVLGYPLFGLH